MINSAQEVKMELDSLKIIWFRKLAIITFCASGMLASLIYSFTLSDLYETKAMVLISHPQESGHSSNEKGSKGLGNVSDPLNMKSYMNLATTPYILNKVIEKLGLKQQPTNEPMYVETLTSMVSVGGASGNVFKDVDESGAGFLSFNVRGSDPKRIQKIANTWTQVLAEESKKMRSGEVMAISKASSDLFSVIKKELEEAQQKLANVQKNYLLDQKDSLLQLYLEQSSGDLKLYANLTNKISDAKARYEILQKQYVREYAAINDKKGKGFALEQSRDSFTLAKLKNKMNDAELEMNSIAPRLKQLEKVTKDWNVKLKNIQDEILDGELSVRRLEVEVRRLGSAYEGISGNVRGIKTKKLLKTSDLRFVSQAIEPKFRVSPDRLKIVLFSGLGCFILGCIVAVLREHVYST